MSERDCGKWYCQKGKFMRLKYGVDVLAWPGTPALDNDRNALDAERQSVTGHRSVIPGGWMGAMRAERGEEIWLAGPGHENGAAKHYWVWDPDSRGRYMECKWFSPGELPFDFGELHKGMGWQLPLLACFTGEPTQEDLATLKRNKCAYTVLGEDVEPEPEPDPEPEPEPEPDDPAPYADYWAREYYALDRIPNWRRRIERKLDTVFMVVLGLVEGEEE